MVVVSSSPEVTVNIKSGERALGARANMAATIWMMRQRFPYPIWSALRGPQRPQYQPLNIHNSPRRQANSILDPTHPVPLEFAGVGRRKDDGPDETKMIIRRAAKAVPRCP